MKKYREGIVFIISLICIGALLLSIGNVTRVLVMGTPAEAIVVKCLRKSKAVIQFPDAEGNTQWAVIQRPHFPLAGKCTLGESYSIRYIPGASPSACVCEPLPIIMRYLGYAIGLSMALLLFLMFLPRRCYAYIIRMAKKSN